MSSREKILKTISDQIGKIAKDISDKNFGETTGMAITATRVCQDILNYTYQYALEDAKDLSGINLIDAEKRVAVQLVSGCTRQDIQESAERFLSAEKPSKFDTLVILVMENDPVPGIRDGFFENKRDLVVLFLSDLVQAMRFLSKEKLEKITDRLAEELSETESALDEKDIEFPEPDFMEGYEFTRADREVLRFALLLPTEGLKRSLFQSALNQSQKEAEKLLVGKKWLVEEQASLLFLNPEIQSRAEAYSDASETAVAEFLGHLWDYEQSWQWYRVNRKEYRTIFLSLAKLYQTAAEQFQDKALVYGRRSVEFWLEIDDYETASELLIKLLDMKNLAGGEQNWDDAYLMHILAFCYLCLGENDKALDCWKEMLSQCEQLAVPDADLAVAHRYVGEGYKKVGDIANARAEFEEEVKLLEPVRTSGKERFAHSGLARAYGRLISTYEDAPRMTPEENKKKDEYSYKKLAAEGVPISDELLESVLSKNLRPMHMLPEVPAASEEFKNGSRDRELDELAGRLRETGAPVFIYGAGGIGKTETAIQLAKKLDPAKGAYYIKYDASDEPDTLRKTILRAKFSNYVYSDIYAENRKKDEYQDRMDILRREYIGTLLIIDNFDSQGKTVEDLQAEETYHELASMEIQLIFVTRNDLKAWNGVEIPPLGSQVLLQLMRDHLHGKCIEDGVLLELIRAANKNTLLVRLIAEMLAHRKGATPENLLEALNQADAADVERRIVTCLNLSGMSEEEYGVLECAAMLPEDGMCYSLFETCLPSDALRSALRDLVAEGYLHRKQELLTIPTVIRDVCIRKLNLSEEVLMVFFSNLRLQFDNEDTSNVEKNWQIAESFSMASDRLCDNTDDVPADLPRMAARYWSMLGMYHRALQYNHQARKLWKKIPDSSGIAMMAINHTIGDTYRRLGMLEEAKNYLISALEIAQKSAYAEELKGQMYLIRSGIMEANLALGDYDAALNFAVDNLTAVREIQRGPWAAAEYNVCQVYIKLERYEEAYGHIHEAIKIGEAAMRRDDPDLAMYYNCAAHVYTALATRENKNGYWKIALEYQKKALRIHEATFPEEHPDLAISYSNMGITLKSLGEHYEALEYQLKAMTIREKVFPPRHPSLATIYHSVGDSYHALGDLQKALDYRKKAMDIRERVLPPKHPDLLASYSIVGYTHLERREYAAAREYLKKLSNLLGKDTREHGILPAVTYFRIGTSYAEEGKFIRAGKHFEMALKCFEEESSSQLIDVATAYSNLGYMLLNQRKYSEARDKMEEAERLAEKNYPKYHPELQTLKNVIAFINDRLAR